MNIDIVRFYCLVTFFILAGCSEVHQYGISPRDDPLTREIFVKLLEENDIKYVYENGFYYVHDVAVEKATAISREANSIAFEQGSFVLEGECSRLAFMMKIDLFGIPYLAKEKDVDVVEVRLLEKDIISYKLVENFSLIKESCDK